MINYINSDLFSSDSVDKQIIIEYDGGTITNKDLFLEELEITESICSEPELLFGSCESSSIKFRAYNIGKKLINQWITAKLVLNKDYDNPFMLGTYKVISDKPTADKKYKSIEAYDKMYEIINSDVSDWYEGLKLPMTMHDFRISFLDYFGLEAEEAELCNDEMVVEKTIESGSLSGKTVINCICSLNGCFGHITREGKFRFVLLPENISGLYPAQDLYPSNSLYPRHTEAALVGKNTYRTCQYEDFLTPKISRLQIRNTEDDIGAIVGSGSDEYVIEDNFLVYGKGADALQLIADNLYSVISKVASYRPMTMESKGNPCIEVGDAIRATTRYEVVESYILSRTLSGIQSLKDTYHSEGASELGATGKINSVSNDFLQLKGKTNEMIRTVDATVSTLKNMENEMDVMKSEISQTAEEIRLEVSRATAREDLLQSSITQTADSISTKVSKGDVISEINQSSEKIYMSAGQLVIDSGNFQLDENGDVTVSGTVNAYMGSIGPFEITDSSIYSSNYGLVLYGNGRIDVSYLYAYGWVSTPTILPASNSNSLSIGGSDDYITIYGSVSMPNLGTTTSPANMVSEGGTIAVSSSSSQRYKHDISEIFSSELSPEKLYGLNVCQYKYNEDYLDESDSRYGKDVIGLIAEEVERVYPIAAEYKDGKIENWNERYIIPAMLYLIQEQKKEIDNLKERMEKYGI